MPSVKNLLSRVSDAEGDFDLPALADIFKKRRNERPNLTSGAKDACESCHMMNRTMKAQLVRASKSLNSKEGTFCKYCHRDCMQNCVEGYDYCIRHILEDKTAPFRQCTYITRSGRKCPNAAPKQDKKDGFCAEHSRKTLISRQRAARKRRPKETTDSLLEELASSSNSYEVQYLNEHRRGKVHSDSIANKALDYASSSDSDTEPLLVEHAWRDNNDSDAESIDSDQEDILKYAGVYTTEEVAQILRDKLIRLQALYIDQFKRLKHILLAKRRKYLEAHKAEKELYGSIKLYKNDPQQREKYNKLCAMKRYHKKFGMEALLQRQSTQRRMQLTEGVHYRPPAFPKCIFMDEGVRCNSKVVPLSKFCQRHIFHDQNQVLYRPCPFADSQCGRPVPSLLGNQFCSLHQPLPLMQEFENNNGDEEVVDYVPDVKPDVGVSGSSKPDGGVGVSITGKPDVADPDKFDDDACVSNPDDSLKLDKADGDIIGGCRNSPASLEKQLDIKEEPMEEKSPVEEQVKLATEAEAVKTDPEDEIDDDQMR